MASEKIEYMIVRAIANLTDNSPFQRQKVYEAAVRSMYNAMGSMTPQERDRRLNALKQSIIEIEMHYQSLSENLEGQPSEVAKEEAVDRNQVGADNNEVFTSAPLESSGSDRILQFLNPFADWKISAGVFGTVFLVFLVAGYTYFQFDNRDNSADNLQLSPSAESTESRTQNQALTEEDGNLIFNAESDVFFEMFKVQGMSDSFQTKTVENEKVHWFSGKTKLISKNSFEIHTDRIYHMSVELRPEDTLPVEDLVIDAGFATYNAERNIETEAPGRHRYFVSNGMIGDNAVRTQDGWFVISGIITGVAANPDAFRKTSKYARPIFMMNIGETKTPLEVRSVKVVELQ